MERHYVSARPLSREAPPQAAAVTTDGLPEDIWLVSAIGGTARRIADVKEDLPAIAWNRDVSHLYVLGAGGLSDVKVATGAVQRIGRGCIPRPDRVRAVMWSSPRLSCSPLRSR